MANQQQYYILKQGVAVWNQWRKAHPNVLPDLSGVSLIKANLTAQNLTRPNLTRPVPPRITLARPDLCKSTFGTAFPYRANLNPTNLTKPNLSLPFFFR